VHEHKIWFTNSSGSNIRQSCRDLFLPVEKINKAIPGPTASVGVPFTYTLTIPVLFDPNGSIVIDDQGSQNDLHSVVIRDDLNETGVDLSYVSHTAYWEHDGTPVTHTFSNVGGLLTFDIGDPVGVDIPAGDQVIIELTVVLDSTPGNTNGTLFFNTAKWDFGREIDGTFYEPLPGEWGISPSMTIAGPDVTVNKTGPAFLNLGEAGVFTLNVQNIGDSDAWNVTLLDRFPNLNGPQTGGMCDVPPTILSAQVFAADDTTPVPGKGPLVAGVDYQASFDPAPACELTLTIDTAAGTIGPEQCN
jgi:uncharacterized repeat protein (TIGR01451 family)